MGVEPRYRACWTKADSFARPSRPYTSLVCSLSTQPCSSPTRDRLPVSTGPGPPRSGGRGCNAIRLGYLMRNACQLPAGALAALDFTFRIADSETEQSAEG